MRTIELNFDHVDGISHLYLINVNGLVRLDRSADDYSARPVISDENFLLEIPVHSNFQISEQNVSDDRGEAFEVRISGFIPRLGMQSTIRELESGEWLAICQDGNGDILLSGSREVPLTFSGSRGGGTGKTGTEFTLTATEPNQSLIMSESSLQVLIDQT